MRMRLHEEASPWVRAIETCALLFGLRRAAMQMHKCMRVCDRSCNAFVYYVEHCLVHCALHL
eukprot:6206799-Pleurochrysis_carterae.AAC.1